MQVPKWALDCVAFLCIDQQSLDGSTKRVPGGTAFRVWVRDEENPKRSWPYVVTARHNIEDSSQDDIYVRINKDYQAESGYVDIHTRREDWESHNKADVAAALLKVPPSGKQGVRYSMAGITFENFVELDRYTGRPLPKEFIDATGGIRLNAGDDVFFTGLFVQRPGREENLPIARFGTISRMPKETIRLPRKGSTGFDAVAYLVEARSWGGHSGSPAFWAYPIVRILDVGGNKVSQQEWLIALLGLVSAHDDIPQRAKRSGEFHNLAGDIVTNINSGIAIVTPATAIKELLMRDDFKEDRRLRRERAKSEEHMPTMDTGLGEAEDGAFTAEVFTEALRRASRKVPSPDREKGEE